MRATQWRAAAVAEAASTFPLPPRQKVSPNRLVRELRNTPTYQSVGRLRAAIDFRPLRDGVWQKFTRE